MRFFSRSRPQAGWSLALSFAILLASCVSTRRAAVTDPSNLTLGPRGARLLLAEAGASLLAMHSADVPRVVHRLTDSISSARGLDQRCTRFFSLDGSVVAIFNRFCAAGDAGRAYAALPVFRFSVAGELIGRELAWESESDLRTPE